jgi:hypothetical protein
MLVRFCMRRSDSMPVNSAVQSRDKASLIRLVPAAGTGYDGLGTMILPGTAQVHDGLM